MKPKYQKNEHNQTDANSFQQVTWLSWVCWQSPVWYKIDCFHLISGIVCYQLQTTRPWRIVQWEISIKKLNKTRAHSSSHRTFPIHCRSLFLCMCFSCISNFLEIINMICLKYCFLFISNIKMARQKFINFDTFLNACWYDSCHNTI